MNQIRKAAVLLMSMPQDEAAAVLSKLKPHQVEAVSIEIARIGSLKAEEQEEAILAFAESNPQLLSSSGGFDLAQALVEKAMGKQAASTLDNVRQSIQSLPFGFLRNVDTQNLLTFVMDEHPQTIALILSHLPSAYGAEVLTGLPAERRLQVIRRIAQMGQTNPEVIKQVEEGLERRMASIMSQSFENAGGVPKVAEILNVTDRGTEKALMEKLAQDDPELVDEIRRRMFVFEDLSKLSDSDIQTVLKNVESAQWAMSLKGASQELKERIFGNMSQRAAQMLVEEMEYLGAVKVSEVETVQQQIVDIIRSLEDANQISTQVNEEEESYID